MHAEYGNLYIDKNAKSRVKVKCSEQTCLQLKRIIGYFLKFNGNTLAPTLSLLKHLKSTMIKLENFRAN